MQMENATRSPSFILPFFQSQDQPHKNGTACCACKWKMPQGLHLSFFHSFKVKINLTKNRIACCTCKWKMPLDPPSIMQGILSKSRSSVVRMGQSNTVSVQLITKEMIPIHFFCKSNFLQIGWSVAKRAVWNNTFCMKSETMLKRLLPLVKLCQNEIAAS